MAKELKFLKMLFDFLNVKCYKPMKIKVDNNGAIHLASNASSGSRTKHIDTRIHFVRELLSGDDKILEIEFVRSDDNESNTNGIRS
jgi:hypothetical protein